MFIDIDYNKEFKKVKLHLSKPNKQVIAHLSEKADGEYSAKLGNINELNFSIPFMIEENGKRIYNKHIDMIHEKMLIKMSFNNTYEWFIIDSINESGDDSTNFNINTFSLGYELSHKRVLAMEYEGIGARALLDDLLKLTTWRVKDVHSKFTAIHRSFEFSNTNILDCIIQASEAFGALLEWDTINKTISFVEFQADAGEISTRGQFKGLSVNYGKLLRSVTKDRTADELTTRFYVYGSEDLGIHTVNPTGQGYLEDFSFFMFPFERDANKNVIKSSHFMTDELCHALLDFQTLLDSNSTSIRTNMEAKAIKTAKLAKDRQDLSSLNMDMEIIKNKLDVAKATEDEGLITQLEGERATKQTAITAQEVVVAQTMTDLLAIDFALETIYKKLNTDSNFNSQLLDELNYYIIEKEWRDDRYIDAKELYEHAVKKFKEVREPKVVISIDMENFLNIIEEQYYWDKLVLGDLIKIRYPEMKMEYMAKIIEIKYKLDDNSIQLTIANATKIGSDIEKLKELLYKSSSASTVLQNNKYKWDKVGFVEDEVYKLINDTHDANKRRITAGVDNLITIDNRGINAKSPSNPQDVVIIQSGIIALSKTGGDKWETALTADGVIADRLIGNVLIGRNLILTNNRNTFLFNDEGISIEVDALKIKSSTNPNLINDWNKVNEKRRVFTTQPIPPYDVGDLWVQGKDGDILKCVTAKTTGKTFATADWQVSSKYTDDARAILAESNAKGYADGLKTQLAKEISDVNTALGNLDTEIKGSFADGLISEAEAISIAKYQNLLNTEKADIDSRYNTIYGDTELTGTTKTTLNTKKVAYNTAHTNLITSITNAIADGATTTIESKDVDAKFVSYRTALSEISKAFEDAVDNIAQAKATKALGDANAFTQGKIDAVNSDITDVNGRLTNLNTYVDGAFKDGVVTTAEKEALKVHIEQLNNEKSDLDARYTQILADTLLTGTARTNLVNAKTHATTGFDKAHTDLISAINVAMSDNDITDAEKANVSSKFATYRTALGGLSGKFEEAIRFVEEFKMSKAFEDAKAFTQGLINAVNKEIGDMNIRVTTLNTYVDGAFKDNVITTAEKEALNVHLEQMRNEKADLDAKYTNIYGDALLTGTPKTNLATAKTNATTGFDKAHTDLISAITTAMIDEDVTEAEKTAVANAFAVYRTRLATLSTRLEEAIRSVEQAKATKALADSKTYTDGKITEVNTDIDDIDRRLGTLNTYVDGAFKDGVITTAEREALRIHIEQLNNEKADIDARYTTIYADTFLVGVAKTNLATAKTNATTGYDKAHTDLISAINTAILDNNITEAEKTAVTTAFTTYRTRLSALSTRFEEAIRYSEQAKADKAKADANDFTQGKIDTVNLEITPTAIVGKVTSSTAWTTQASTITQQAGKIALVVGSDDKIKADSIASSLSLTPTAMNLISQAIDITGKVTFLSFDPTTKSSLTTTTGWITAGKTTINGGSIEAKTISASSIKTEELIVGTNIQMGANAYITWGQVSNQPFIPTSASQIGGITPSSPQLTYINSTGVYTGTVSATQFYGDSYIVGRGGSRRLELYANSGDDRLISVGADGFRVSSDGSLSLTAGSSYGVYIKYAPFAILGQNFRLHKTGESNGATLISTNIVNSVVSIDGTLRVTNLEVTGSNGNVATFG